MRQCSGKREQPVQRCEAKGCLKKRPVWCKQSKEGEVREKAAHVKQGGQTE